MRLLSKPPITPAAAPAPQPTPAPAAPPPAAAAAAAPHPDPAYAAFLASQAAAKPPSVQGYVVPPTPAPALPAPAAPNGSAQLPSLMSDAFFAGIGAYTPEQAALVPAVQSALSAPVLDWYHPKQPCAPDVVKALGALAEGTPYLRSPAGVFARAEGLGFCVLGDELAESVFYCERGGPPNYRPISAYRQERAGLELWIRAVLLVLPGTIAPPAGFGASAPGGAFCVSAELKTTKAAFVQEHLAEVGRSCTPEWAREGRNGELVTAVPPRLRVVSTLRLKAATSRSSGHPYTVAHAASSAINLAQLHAVAAWRHDAAAMAALEAVAQAHATECETIAKLVARTSAPA